MAIVVRDAMGTSLSSMALAVSSSDAPYALDHWNSEPQPHDDGIMVGSAVPLGVTVSRQGVNFAITLENATVVALSVSAEGKSHRTVKIWTLQSQVHRTDHVWHAFVAGLQPPFTYQFLINFRGKLLGLLDPYSRLLTTALKWGERLRDEGPCGLVVDAAFDWDDDRAPRHPWHKTLIYEMHVRGFTVNDSTLEYPGTYKALIHKIPYLKSLGVTAVELMPIFEFDENHCHFHGPEGRPLQNYWGYQPLSFFAPMRRYSAAVAPGAAKKEFQQVVRALHASGIEVLLDVVYNHTGDFGDERAPRSPLSLHKRKYYSHNALNGEEFNFSGCGNTLNPNDEKVRRLILDSMRYWVGEMHVDGFRLDLASVLQRSPTGDLLAPSPLIRDISDDPLLKEVKLIAEPWDAQGGYQLGRFHPGGVWREWNDRFRDDVRAFLNGRGGSKGAFATRLCGSSDIFKGQGPTNSINFFACHDGFTLADLTSYDHKHNQANGEHNRDGCNDNYSWNCGVEGPTAAAHVLQLRQRQRKNFMLALFLAAGVPMLHMGDESAHTKNGNNNSYCQGDEVNGLSWESMDSASADLLLFTQRLSRWRHQEALLQNESFLTDADVTWHGRQPYKPCWDDGDAFLAFCRHDANSAKAYYIAFNACAAEVKTLLPPPLPNQQWHLFLDTARDAVGRRPVEIIAAEYTLRDHSAIVLQSA